MLKGLQGIDVTLYQQTVSGQDPIGADILVETPISVSDVLVMPVSSDDIVNNFTTEGQRIVYQLAIPKGDTHDWENKKVSFFGETFKTFGKPVQGIEANIPLRWNKKVYCGYEQG